MKWKALIVLLAIALSVVVPPSPFLSDPGAIATIGTLDICHAAAPALSSNGDMPFEIVASAHPVPVTLLENAYIVQQPCKPCFIALLDERPPQLLL